jgi:hypothetical protein
MQMPFVTTVAFAGWDGASVSLQYGISAGNEAEARTEIQQRLINQEICNYSIVEVRRATRDEAHLLNLPAGSIKLLN